ncbi:MAG TPA: hypothetical protein VFB12_29835 [Ktedonobacteraceae bacterium]|nr:hypothetical protein [Ktedonobacteraceae bacterium]
MFIPWVGTASPLFRQRRTGPIAHKGRRYAVRASVDRVAPPLVGNWT